jgi:hypothetical protein
VLAGPLVVLDPDSFAPKAKKHFFLLTKLLIVSLLGLHARGCFG